MRISRQRDRFFLRFRRSFRSGFTLIELLVVVAIIGILVALLFPALASAINNARRVSAMAEVKSIETALKKYYQEYTCWPSTFSETTAMKVEGSGGNQLAYMLRGSNVVFGGVGGNPKLLEFMEFTRVDSSGSPVNPWGKTVPAANGSTNYYYAKFDVDFNNEIVSSGGTGPNAQPTNNVRASVIVWTYNPKVPPSKPDHVIGSWGR